jgi:hypothetical protein
MSEENTVDGTKLLGAVFDVSGGMLQGKLLTGLPSQG